MVVGLDAALAEVRRLVGAFASEFVGDTAHGIAAVAMTRHPWRNRTGALELSIHVETTGGFMGVGPRRVGGGGYLARVGASAINSVGDDYARYVEFRYDRGERWSYLSPAARAVLVGHAQQLVTDAMVRVAAGGGVWSAGVSVNPLAVRLLGGFDVPSPQALREAADAGAD